MELSGIPANLRELLEMLANLSRLGPIPAVGTGDPSVGMTLLSRLNIPYSSHEKPQFKGIALSARRGTKAKDPNRVNLFAKVPDWEISNCKSSREIVELFGYDRGEGKKLYCTVNARQPNNQGLMLEVDHGKRLMHEIHVSSTSSKSPVASWRINHLIEKLAKSHKASIWIIAVQSFRQEQEYFHFRYATVTSEPRTSALTPLIEQGIITMDHLIWDRSSRVVEKGPLFKIKPANVEALFPITAKIDLLSL